MDEYEHFSDRARKVVALANQEAHRLNHAYVGTEHLLLGLVNEGTGVAATVLKNAGLDPHSVRGEIEKLIKAGPPSTQMGRLPPTSRTRRTFAEAHAEARKLGHEYIGTEHLLLGLLAEREGVAAHVLTGLGLSLDRARRDVCEVLCLPPPEAAPSRDPIARGADADGRGSVSDRATADGRPIGDFYTDDIVGRLLQELSAELIARKDAAIQRAEYEQAAGYRDLAVAARRMLRQLGSILCRRPPSDP